MKIDWKRNIVGLAILLVVLASAMAISARIVEGCGYPGCDPSTSPFVFVDNASNEWRKSHPEVIKAHVYPDGYMHEVEVVGAASPRQDTNYAVNRSIVGKKGDMILLRANTIALYYDDSNSNWPTRHVGPGNGPGCWDWKVSAEKVLIQGNTDQNGGVRSPRLWELGNLPPCGYPAEYPPKGHPTWIVTRGYGEATLQPYDCYDEDYCPPRRPAPCGYAPYPACPAPAPSYPPSYGYWPTVAQGWCPSSSEDARVHLGGGEARFWSYIGSAAGYHKWLFDAGYNNPRRLHVPRTSNGETVGNYDTWKYGHGYRGADFDLESATYNCTG